MNGVRLRVLAPWLVAAGLVLAASGPASAAMQLTIAPDAPTWNDEVTVTARGERTTTCDSSYFSLVESHRGAGTVDLELRDHCPFLTPGGSRTIEVSRTIGQLDPGGWTVRLNDPAEPQDVVAPLTVYHPGTATIELPAAAATDAAPATVKVRFAAHIIGAPHATVEVLGSVVRMTVFATDPPGPPPFPLQAYSLDVPLPLLGAGEYRLEVLDLDALTGDEMTAAALRVWDHRGCVPSAEALCLQNGRFRVTASWTAFDGSQGVALAHPLPGNEGSGLLSFFDPDNAELTVKALDGCALDQHWWLFLASGSNVAYEVTVEDTHTGAHRSYANPTGTLPPLIDDTSAFPCPEPRSGLAR